MSLIEADRSVSPARVDISVGQRFDITPSIDDERPRNCNTGYRTGREVVRSTDPSVVALDARGDHGWHFAGVAPGTARLVAEGLQTPTGATTTASLTVCADPEAYFTCSNRVPLEIRVVP